jgi:hypothetical protein
MLTGKRFRLERATLVIDYAGDRPHARTIPLGSVLEVEGGPRDGDGLVDVIWDGNVYSMFEEDLKARGTEL